MKIIILGSTGMLGNVVSRYFIKQYGEDNVFLSYRNKNIDIKKNMFFLDALNFNYKECVLPECDYIINCIGAIKQIKDWNTYESIKINSCFPWELGKYCEYKNSKLIHITTDCVFSGKDGNYNEESLHDPLDEYGKSKSLGEVQGKNVITLRTSIIGEEIYKNISLISWVKSQMGKNINGYINHFWNGITTLQYAKVCDSIIKEKLCDNGLYHIFSNVVSKYDLVNIINDHFNLDITVDSFKADPSCDRTLSTTKDLNSQLNIPSIKEQVDSI